MRRNAVLLVVVLILAVAGVAFLLRGEKLGEGPGTAGEGAGATDTPIGGTEAAVPTEGVRGARAVRDAVLFGRPREERAGVGAVQGRVARVAGATPLPDARVLLAGVAYDGSEVAVRGTTDEDGFFHLHPVAAGDGYALRVEATGEPPRTVPGISVSARGSADLGTIWLGAPGGLEGRVVNAAGRPVPNAEVLVHVGTISLLDLLGNIAELFATLDREPEPLARTMTASDGTFRFDALDPGPIVVVARARGYQQVMKSTAVASGTSSPHPLVLHLPEGKRTAGRIFDEADRGIAGARVAAVAGNDPFAFLYGRSFTSTDAGGRFEIDTTGGRDAISLLVSAPGFAMATHRVEPGNKEVLIELRRGSTLTLRFLVEPDDEPLEGADVWVTVGDDPDPTADRRQSFGGGRTDASGELQVETGSGSLQMVWVTHPLHATAMWVGAAIAGAAGRGMKGPEDPTVRPGPQEMVFLLPANLAIRGQVTAPDGTPLAGARVMSFGGMAFGKPVHTDAEGRYALHTTRLTPGSGMAMVMVQASGYVQPQAAMMVDTSVLVAGAVVHDVVLEAAGVVSGRVLGPEGRGIAGAQVRAEAQGGAAMTLDRFTPRQTFAGAGGRYLLDGVPPGTEVRVMARHPGFVDAASEPFAVTAGATVPGRDVTLAAGGTLEVEVRSPGGGTLPDADVEFSYERTDTLTWDYFESLRSNASRLTDEQGTVRQTQVPEGKVRITVTHPEFAAAGVDVTVVPGGPAVLRVTVTMRMPATVSGRVVDAAGKPVAGAMITARPADEDSHAGRATGSTDADGRFRLERLVAGPNHVEVSASGFERHTMEIQAPAEDLPIRLVPADPDREGRFEVIAARMGELSAALQTARSEAEREALIAEIQLLNEEFQKIRRQDDE